MHPIAIVIIVVILCAAMWDYICVIALLVYLAAKNLLNKCPWFKPKSHNECLNNDHVESGLPETSTTVPGEEVAKGDKQVGVSKEIVLQNGAGDHGEVAPPPPPTADADDNRPASEDSSPPPDYGTIKN